jgi:hypothetical protein
MPRIRISTHLKKLQPKLQQDAAAAEGEQVELAQEEVLAVLEEVCKGPRH